VSVVRPFALGHALHLGGVTQPLSGVVLSPRFTRLFQSRTASMASYAGARNSQPSSVAV
jgi:hypothetical protein